MSHLSINFFSNSLKRNISFEMIIPNDFKEDELISNSEYRNRRMKTLLLLHGYTGCAGNWISEELIQKYNFAVVMPSGENSFYLDGLSTGHKFCTYVGDELIRYVRKTFNLALNADETYIMGMSMGGFGAIHTGYTYPDVFGKIGAMSPALIVHDIAHMKETEGNDVANYHYYHECFGDLETVEESDNNPETIIYKLKATGDNLPQLYMCCGTEDFLLRNNREFHKFLCDNDVEHQYYESIGNHDMTFWNEYTQKIIEWMFK